MNVLIVDDDLEIRTALVASVKSVRCDLIDTAESGEEALGIAVQNAYDLVTLDIEMSGVSGLDILSMMRTLLPWSVIAIISGHTSLISGEDLGGAADLVISKPFSVEKIRNLAELAKELAEKRESVRELNEWTETPIR